MRGLAALIAELQAVGATVPARPCGRHLVQRWLGHASLRTTSIYGDVMGPEERAFAERMWSGSS